MSGFDAKGIIESTTYCVYILRDEGLASVGAGGCFPDCVMLSLTGVLNTDSVTLLPLHLFILVK